MVSHAHTDCAKWWMTMVSHAHTDCCSQVRGVAAGGIVSTAYCLLFKLFTFKLTRKQLTAMLKHRDSPYIRGIGFMYIRSAYKCLCMVKVVTAVDPQQIQTPTTPHWKVLWS